MSQKTLERLEHLQKLNSNRQWVNHDLYRLLYKEDLYIVAYERIKSKPGNMTPGTDKETLDGYSLEDIREIIREMKTEQFRFKPVRQQFIPKPNGKMRKLGIPCVRDKVVQEVMHMILEGDIRACFDELDHHILVKALSGKIQDQRFLNLIWKLLNAGYMDLHGMKKDSLIGSPQGGLVSPILANVYLHELDEFIEGLGTKLEKGVEKRNNPTYKRLSLKKGRMLKRGETRTPEFREVAKEMRRTPSRMVNDPDYIRIKYLRYADDWVVGVCGSQALAEAIKREIKTFLGEKLKLTLSEEKRTLPTREPRKHFSSEQPSKLVMEGKPK